MLCHVKRWHIKKKTQSSFDEIARRLIISTLNRGCVGSEMIDFPSMNREKRTYHAIVHVAWWKRAIYYEYSLGRNSDENKQNLCQIKNSGLDLIFKSFWKIFLKSELLFFKKWQFRETGILGLFWWIYKETLRRPLISSSSHHLIISSSL